MKENIILPKENFEELTAQLGRLPYAAVCNIFPLLDAAKLHEKTEVDEAVLLELQQFNSFMNKFYDKLKKENLRIAKNESNGKYDLFEGLIQSNNLVHGGMDDGRDFEYHFKYFVNELLKIINSHKEEI